MAAHSIHPAPDVIAERTNHNSDHPTVGVWIAVFLLGMCALLNLYVTQPVLGQIADWADISTTAAAWTISATTLGVAITAPIAGAISDRFGRKKLMVWSLVLVISATLLCATSPPFTVVLGLRFLQGIGIPFVFAVVVAYIAEEFDRTDSARLNAVYVAGTAFGGFSGRFLSGAVVSTTDQWQLVFLPVTGLLLLTLLVMLRYLPVERRFRPTQSMRSRWMSLGGSLLNRRLLGTCLVGAMLLFIQVTSFTYGSLYLQEEPFRLSPIQVSLVFLVFLIPTILTPLVGVLLSRVGEVRTFQLGSILGIGGLLLTLVPSSPAVIAGLAGSCVAVFAGQACATRFTAIRFSTFRSAAVGWYLTAYYLGGTLGGVVPAPIFSTYGWGACIVILVLSAISAMIVATVSWRN